VAVTVAILPLSGLADRDAQLVSVVGDFNDWDPHMTPAQAGAGRSQRGHDLAVGRTSPLPYLAQDGNWFDDPDADSYINNGLGDFDGVLDLRAPTAQDKAEEP
jgi:hypothetical protein